MIARVRRRLLCHWFALWQRLRGKSPSLDNGPAPGVVDNILLGIMEDTKKNVENGSGGQVGERDSLINYMEHLHSKFKRCLDKLKVSECCPHFREQRSRGPQTQGETLKAQPQAKVNFKTQDSQANSRGNS